MKLLETCFYRACLILCLFSAGYMTYLQFKHYLTNEDVASISYRRFNEEEKDEYPTISICLKNLGGKIFKQNYDVFQSPNITRNSYGYFLLGNLDDESTIFSAIKFDEAAIDFYDGYLVGTHETGSNIRFTFFNLIEQFAFSMVSTFQDPERLCVSKHIPFRKNNEQYVDVIHLNSSRLYNDELIVEIYVHQTGNLLRNLDTPTTRFPPNNKTEEGLKRIFDVGQVDILRKRANSKITCDEQITNEDEYILEQLMINAGCIPTFWAKYAIRIGLNQTVRMLSLIHI